MKPATVARSTWSAECGRILRFGGVGLAATAVYLAVSSACVHVLKLGPVFGSILGQTASMSISYFGHALFSFRVPMDHRNYLVRFLLIAALTFALNGAVVEVLVHWLQLPYLIAISLVTILIPATNYLCNRNWVFIAGIDHPQHAAAPNK